MFQTLAEMPLVAVEVPLIEPDAVRTSTVSASPEASDANSLKYQFHVASIAGSTLHRAPTQASFGANPVSHVVWELNAEEPSELVLREISLEGSQAQAGNACVKFSTSILPSIVGRATPCACQLYVITADGVFHVITWLSSELPAHQPPIVQSIPMTALFDRVGQPATIVLLDTSTLCIGTTQGIVLCLAADDPSPERSCFELYPSGSGLLGGFLGNIFGTRNPQSVEQILEIYHSGRSYLCTFHSGANFYVWDVRQRRLLHSCTLLPPEEAPALHVTCARAIQEPVDPSRLILVLSFASYESQFASRMQTFELFLEDRGSGAIKVGLEAGALLGGELKRVIDISLQQVTSQAIAAWILHENGQGFHSLDCIPLSFADTEVQNLTKVQFLEDQVEALIPPTPEHFNILGKLSEKLHSAACNDADTSLMSLSPSPMDAFADILCAPGCLSIQALQTTFHRLRWSAIPFHANIEFRKCLIEAVEQAGKEYPNGSLGAWSDLLQTYVTAARAACPPIALVQYGSCRQSSWSNVLVLRAGGKISLVRPTEASEFAALGLWPHVWDGQLDASAHRSGLKSVLQAVYAVSEAAGGNAMLPLLRSCYTRFGNLNSSLLQAVVDFVTGGFPDAPEEWRTVCRRLPSRVGKLCGASRIGVGACLDQLVTLLSQSIQEANRLPRSSPGADSSNQSLGPARLAALACAHQMATAQLHCLLRVNLFIAYLSKSQILGTWFLSDADRKQLGQLLPSRLSEMSATANVACWSTAAPIARHSLVHSLDPSELVVALRLGGETGRTEGSKRSRLDPVADAVYPAEHLFKYFLSASIQGIEQDVGDVNHVAMAFARWLLYSPDDSSLSDAAPLGTQRAFLLASALLQTRSIDALIQLMEFMRQGSHDDPRALFYLACAKTLMLPTARGSVRRKLEEECVTLFFRVASTYVHHAFFNEQLDAVHDALHTLQAAEPIQLISDASEDAIIAAKEVYYHEALANLFLQLDCDSAACKFALAAAGLVTAALPDGASVEERVSRSSHLWTSIFQICLRSGKYLDAYAALLANDVADVQVDQVHQLVNEMASQGEVLTLCSLPFGHSVLVVRSGRPTWVSFLDEAMSALASNAAHHDVNTVPQPYWTLYDFHVSHGNYQSAAAAMLAYSRRVVVEGSDDRAAAEEAQRALAAAVGALSLVKPEQAWLEDPGPYKMSLFSADGATAGSNQASPIVTLVDLKIEHAVSMARKAVLEIMPDCQTASFGADDLIYQLLVLRLHDEAFSLADTAFTGTKRQRMQERVVEGLAVLCAQLQVRTKSPSHALEESSLVTTEDMDEGLIDNDNMDAFGPSTANGPKRNGDFITVDGDNTMWEASSTADPCWRRLRSHLERYEKSGRALDSGRLRLVAVGAILSTHPKICPPLWLLNPFFPSISNDVLSKANTGNTHADLPGLLRLYVAQGRVDQAAAMALRALKPLVDTVPSVAMPSPAVVCLPHALLHDIMERLSMQKPVRGELADALAKVERIASRQTAVLAEIYAS